MGTSSNIYENYSTEKEVFILFLLKMLRRLDRKMLRKAENKIKRLEVA